MSLATKAGYELHQGKRVNPELKAHGDSDIHREVPYK